MVALVIDKVETPLDGRFAENVVVQVKSGPLGFQVREPVSPVLAAMPRTRLALEVQVTREYTSQQRHICHLAPQSLQIPGFRRGVESCSASPG